LNLDLFHLPVQTFCPTTPALEIIIPNIHESAPHTVPSLTNSAFPPGHNSHTLEAFKEASQKEGSEISGQLPPVQERSLTPRGHPPITDLRHNMELYKPQPRRVDHHNHDLAQHHSTTFIQNPRIQRPNQPPPVIPERDRPDSIPIKFLPYGLGTMDIQHQTQRSQPSTVTSVNSRSLRAANAATLLDLETPNLYHQVDDTHNALCSKCHGIILNPVDGLQLPEAPLPPGKYDNWNYIYPINHPALQRNNSIGGFTLTGQDSQKSTRSCLSKICSSHKIALVVSTFSFLVTIGLTITLILMKNKGMMEPM